MSTKKKPAGNVKTKADIEIIKSAENLLIDKEKRYQRKVKGPQVENQTTLKMPMKPKANKLTEKKTAEKKK